MTYTLSNLDLWNALEIGSLSIPLVFQVQAFCLCMSHWSPSMYSFREVAACSMTTACSTR